jgi:RNA polymerase sigma-70 factor (ECF subfamily)
VTAETTGLSDASDAEVVSAIARGDEPALAELYRRHAASVYGLCLKLLRDADTAQEVLQETIVSLWERPDRFDADRGALRPYLLRLAHGKAVDRMRSETRRAAREERHFRREPVDGNDLEREVWEVVRAETVRTALHDLGDGERRAIELAYFGGHSYREVAMMLGEPEGTVKSRIRSGMRKLAETLEAVGLAPGGGSAGGTTGVESTAPSAREDRP